MKIALPNAGKSLDSKLAQIFGRSDYFIIAQVENNEIKSFEAIENSAKNEHHAGIKIAQILVAKGVEVVIAKEVGANAENILSSKGIRIVNCNEEVSVKEAIQKFLRGEIWF